MFQSHRQKLTCTRMESKFDSHRCIFLIKKISCFLVKHDFIELDTKHNDEDVQCKSGPIFIIKVPTILNIKKFFLKENPPLSSITPTIKQ